MQISIIGAGNMAHGIGTRVIVGKHDLTIYDRSLQRASDLAAKLGGGTKALALDKNIEGEIIIFALPYQIIPEVIEKFKDSIAGKVLVDISNPIDFQSMQLIPPSETSGAQEIAKHLPWGAKLVKAFNTTFAGTLITGEVSGQKLDVFIAGDDNDAKEMVAKLAEDGGLRPLDVGPLSRAKHLEGFQLVQMTLQEKLGTNWLSAIKILP